MGYLMDAPRSVDPMIRILRDMGQYKYDPSDVFRDFIDYGIGCLLVDGDKVMAERMMKKYGADYVQLGNLLRAWIQILDQQVTDSPHSWFDALGTIYEYLASQYKKSWLGQFFTPPDLCDLMTNITSRPESRPVGKRVNDPTCGSGRLLLSFNAYNPGNLLYGEDLDSICTRMTALNMAMHGCQGQVFCCNSLSLDDWRFGYQVNPYHRYGAPPIPHLLPIQKEQSLTWQYWQTQRRKPPEIRSPEPVTASPVLVTQEGPVPAQLSLF